MTFSDPLDSFGRSRVVVTGMGAVSALGTGADTLWHGLLAGRSGVGPITLFDPSDFTCRIAAEVPALPHVPAQVGPYAIQERPYVLAVAAAAEALRQSGALDSGVPADRRVALVSGGSTDELLGLIAAVAADQAGPDRPLADLTAADLVPHYPDHPRAADLDRYCGSLLGPVSATLFGARSAYCVSTACAGGSQAIGNAVRLLRDGDADMALAGGCDCLVTRQIVSGFSKLSALSTRNDEPHRASRPFDAERDGFVLGEATGMFVLETAEGALRRGATVLAELAGVGFSGDAYRLTDPQPDGSGMFLSMARAIEDAGESPERIDHVNAHGTSTKMNDAAETRAIRQVLGEHADRVTVSSTKSMTGHPIHAAGALESVACIQTLRDQVIHPTANYENPDPACDLDYVPGDPREADVAVVLNNSFGFGGQNTTLLFRRWEG